MTDIAQTRSIVALVLDMLNAVKGDRLIVKEDHRIADVLQSGIGSGEVAVAIAGAIGEEPLPEVVHPEMTILEVSQALVDAGHEPVYIVE